MAPIRQAEPKERNDDEDGSESSRESEELEKSDSESESDEEEVPSTPILKKHSAQKKSQTPKTPSHPQSSSSGESHSESDSPPRPDPKVKPIAFKAVEEPPEKAASKKPRTKHGSAARADKSAASKRQEETENKGKRESKREKRKASVVEEDTAKKIGDNSNKKQLFQRLWSVDDEIAILMGMIEYTAKKGVEPGGDMNGFLEFVKKSLHVDVTKIQLYEKVRRLRKKYENNLRKGRGGKDQTFSKSHEQKAFELSKKIWGNSGGNGLGNGSSKAVGSVRKDKNQRSSVASPTKREKITEIEAEPNGGVFRSIGFYGCIGGVSLDEEFVKNGLELISDSDKLELEGKWKKLREDEMEFYLKRVGLIREQTELVLEVLRSSGD